MTRKIQTQSRRRFRFSPAIVISVCALFMAISGAAVALPGTDTVNSGDIKDNKVKSIDLKDNKAVESVDVVDDTLTKDDLGPDSVRSPELGDGIHAHSNATAVNGGAGENGAYLTGTATASCGGGEELISGSGHWSNGLGGEELFLSEVRLNHNTESVSVRGGNDSGNNRTLVAVAHCLG